MTQPTLDVEAARAAGVTLEEEVYADYWGFEDTQRHYLPDGKQYFLIQRMTEGDKAKYQRDIRSDVTVERSTGNARLKSDPATERHALLNACVVGWFLVKRGQDGKYTEVPFDKSGRTSTFDKWLEKADPRIVEDLEKACRKLNPWLLQDLSVEDIDKQIEDLQEMREEVLKRQAGE